MIQSIPGSFQHLLETFEAYWRSKTFRESHRSDPQNFEQPHSCFIVINVVRKNQYDQAVQAYKEVDPECVESWNAIVEENAGADSETMLRLFKKTFKPEIEQG